MVAPIGDGRAALWSGSSASYVDLHPAWARSSQIWAMSGVLQGGDAFVPVPGGFSEHAVIWQGTAASMVDLHPVQVLSPNANSRILGMGPGQQVGGAGLHAAMWTGSAASYVDMHPFPGTSNSELLDADCGVQVGWSHVPGFSFPRAGIWFGTPNSFVDLTPFLPAGYSSAVATSVFVDGGTITVGGYASGPNGAEAFMWIGVPAPGAGGVLLLAAAIAGRRRRRS